MNYTLIFNVESLDYHRYIMHKTIAVSDNSIQGDLNHPCILLVDDDTEVLHFLSELFRDNFSVITAECGQSAYDKAVSLKPDCIVSDVKMPHMDGLELCRKIRSNVHISQTPIILLSALVEEGDRIRGYESLADNYFTKPVRPRELLAAALALTFRRKYSVAVAEIDVKKIIPGAFTLDDEQLLQRLDAYIQMNICDSCLDVTTLARKCYMGKRQFERKIKRIKGVSPARYLRNIRMEKAREMLETNQCKSVSQLASLVGYLSSRSFSRAYKQTFGTSPLASL